MNAAHAAYVAAEQAYNDAASAESAAKEELAGFEKAYADAKAEHDQVIANSGNGELQQAAATLEQAKAAYEKAQEVSKDLADKRNALETERDTELAKYQAQAKAALDEANQKLSDLMAGADSDLSTLKQAMDDAQVAYEQALETYNTNAANEGVTKSYAEAKQAYDDAVAKHDDAQKDLEDADKNLQAAKDALAAITGGNTQNLNDDANNDSEPNTVSDGDDSTGDSADPDSSGETTGSDPGTGGEGSGTEEPATPGTDPDPNEVANAEAEVNRCQGIYDEAARVEGETKATMEAAEAVLRAAERV